MRHASCALILALALHLVLASPASAQGSNDCDSAQLVSGAGPHTFVTRNATTDGHDEGVLVRPGLRQIENDVWFRWVAPSTAVYEIDTDHPPTTNGATAVAVYRFGCSTDSGRAIAGQMGNGASIFAIVRFGAEAGTEYLIRVGNTVSQNRTSGIFTIEDVSPPGVLTTAVNPDNGRTYHMLEPSSWSEARIAALELGGDLVTVNDQAENDWLMATFWSFEGQSRSLWLGYSDAETEGTWVWANGETPGYENWSPPGSPNNGNEYEHYAHIRKDWDDGTWNDLLGFPGASFFYDEVHGIVEVREVGVRFLRGDSDDDGAHRISDAVLTLTFLFLAGPEPACMDAADSDDSGSVAITDAVYILDYLFRGGDVPPPPFPEHGVDPTDDAVDCRGM